MSNLEPLTPKDIITHLNSIDDLLSVKERWTQGVGARNNEGLAVSPNHSKATCWCLLGASFAVTFHPDETIHRHRHGEVAAYLIMTMQAKLHQIGITLGEFNDDHTFEEVKQLVAMTRNHLESKIYTDSVAGIVAQ